MLREFIPGITSVTGRPRNPSNQGSIEVLNGLVKKVIYGLEEQDWQNNVVPNWTQYLGRVMSSINAMAQQRGRYNVSSYKSIYGFPYNGADMGNLSKLLQGTTVEERM